MPKKNNITEPANLVNAMRELAIGEKIILKVERLTYARTQASALNTVRGVKSLVVRPRPECGIIEVVREQ